MPQAIKEIFYQMEGLWVEVSLGKISPKLYLMHLLERVHVFVRVRDI